MTPALVAASAEAVPVCAIENTELILVTQAALLHSPSFALLEGRPEPARLPPRRCLFLNGDELMARGWRERRREAEFDDVTRTGVIQGSFTFRTRTAKWMVSMDWYTVN